MKKNGNFGKRLCYLLACYGMGMGIFSLFRLANTLVFRMQAGPQDWGMGLPKALLMGLRFDTVISCYVLALPLLAFFIGSLCRIRSSAYYRCFHWYTVCGFLLCFLGCAADIPYFNYFFTRLNVSALAWMDSFSFVVKMIAEEPRFLVFAFAFLAVAAAYVWLMQRLMRRFLKTDGLPDRPLAESALGLLLIACCLLGMRGRLSVKSPIRVGTAYFSNNAFLNQLGLNPMFTFLNSISENRRNREVRLADSDAARSVAETELQRFSAADSACIRLEPGTNVVLVLMESMAAHKVGHYNPESRLTPQLDRIIAQSLCYENAYSAGIHTYNGIYSTLFSMPAILDRHSMKKTQIPSMHGLPNVMKEKAYHTLYFTTHDEQFDNVAGFLYGNGVERIVSQKDYPAREIKSTLGVPDHVMFDRALKELDAQQQPFFACLLTASDHNPHIFPEGIDLKPQSKELGTQMVEYADWAIGRFLRQAEKRAWFRHTVFVFVADHGAYGETDYDMSLSYHHVPLFFYAPGRIPAQRRTELAQQIDIGPTLIGMLWPGEPNLTLGLDLQRQKREYVFFSADNKIGVLDSAYFYRYRVADGNESLYRYRGHDTRDYLPDRKSKADSMRTYGFSMIQYAYDKLK